MIYLDTQVQNNAHVGVPDSVSVLNRKEMMQIT